MSRIPATKRIPFFGTALSVLFILILSPLRPAFAKTAASADSARFSVQTVRPRYLELARQFEETAVAAEKLGAELSSREFFHFN